MVLYFYPTGEATRQLWESFDSDGAIGAVCDEYNVVLEDYQGTEKDTSKEALAKQKLRNISISALLRYSL